MEILDFIVVFLIVQTIIFLLVIIWICCQIRELKKTNNNGANGNKNADEKKDNYQQLSQDDQVENQDCTIQIQRKTLEQDQNEQNKHHPPKIIKQQQENQNLIPDEQQKKNQVDQELKTLRDNFQNLQKQIQQLNSYFFEIKQDSQHDDFIIKLQELERKIGNQSKQENLLMEREKNDILQQLSKFESFQEKTLQFLSDQNSEQHQRNYEVCLRELLELKNAFQQNPNQVDINKSDIDFDQNRLQITQGIIYKLYNETNNQRPVDYNFRPFVRQFQDLNELKNNYNLTPQSKKSISEHCNGFKPVRGDGNCFYTAFGFQFFKQLLNNYRDYDFENFIQNCTKMQLPMKLYCENSQVVQEDEEKELLKEFLYRLTKLRKIKVLKDRMEQYEAEFAAFEKQNDEVDGCFYGLATIFLRNYSNYAVDFHEMKEAIFDRQNLLIWEIECNSNEIVIDALAKLLNVHVKLFFMNDKSFDLKEYGQKGNPVINLLIKPGHYNIGVSSVDEKVENLEGIEAQENQQEFNLETIVQKIVQVLLKLIENLQPNQKTLQELKHMQQIQVKY